MEKKEAIEILKDFHDKSALFSVRTALETLIPELKESDDERIRKELIKYLPYCDDISKDTKERWIAWLEKQGEQKPELKFKVGDWIISPGGCYLHILDIKKDGYLCKDIIGKEVKVLCEHSNSDYKLWTIQNAKDGDVLVSKIEGEPNDFIYIFNRLDESKGFWSHCYLDSSYANNFHKGKYYHNNDNGGIPATKEQRDLLFQKMKEAGYEWDVEKKELK